VYPNWHVFSIISLGVIRIDMILQNKKHIILCDVSIHDVRLTFSTREVYGLLIVCSYNQFWRISKEDSATRSAIFNLWFFLVECNRVQYYCGHCWPTVPAPDDDECGAIGRMLGSRNQSIRRKPAPVPLCSPQIPHDPTRAAAMGSQRLTAWATARPSTYDTAWLLTEG
jgi:hypothetical protein